MLSGGCTSIPAARSAPLAIINKVATEVLPTPGVAAVGVRNRRLLSGVGVKLGNSGSSQSVPEEAEHVEATSSGTRVDAMLLRSAALFFLFVDLPPKKATADLQEFTFASLLDNCLT